MTGIPNVRQQGTRLGNWLTPEQAKELLAVPDRSRLKGKRDYVILSLLVRLRPSQKGTGLPTFLYRGHADAYRGHSDA